jgi:hypothetical protein
MSFLAIWSFRIYNGSSRGVYDIRDTKPQNGKRLDLSRDWSVKYLYFTMLVYFA